MSFSVLPHPKATEELNEIKRDSDQVIILYIDHRRNVYDDFSRIF